MEQYRTVHTACMCRIMLFVTITFISQLAQDCMYAKMYKAVNNIKPFFILITSSLEIKRFIIFKSLLKCFSCLIFSQRLNILVRPQDKRSIRNKLRLKKLEKRICLKILLEIAKIEIKTHLARKKISLCKRNNNTVIFCYLFS